MKMKKITLIAIAFFCTISGFSQEFMTLEQYREKVLEYSQIVKQSKENVKMSASQIKEAKSNLYPRIDAAADFNYLINKIDFDLGAGQSLDVSRIGYGVSTTVSQNVYSGGVVRKQVNALEMNKRIAEYSLELTRENISYAADLSYWSLSAVASFKKAAVDYLEIIQQTYKIIKDRYDDGLISKNDLLMIESRLQAAEYQLSSVSSQFKEASINLNLLMGADADNVVLVDTLLGHPTILPKYRDLQSVLENKASFAIADENVDLANQSLKITRSQYLPKIAVGVKGQIATPSLNITGEGQLAAVAFAQVSVPIYAGSHKKHQSAVAVSKIRVSEYERQKVIDDIYKGLSVAWSNLSNTYNQIEIAHNSLNISEESLDLNTFSYNEGVLELLDVLSSQITWLDAYNNLISTHFSFIQAQVTYKQAIGEY